MTEPEPEIDYCVDCDTLTPATDEIVTDTYVIDGETYEHVELVCLAHKIAYERSAALSAMAAEESDTGPDKFVETR